MDISWSLQIPDPQRQDRGQKWQTAVSAWLIESAYQFSTKRNTQRNTPNPTTEIDTALCKTTAQIHNIYRLIDEHLSVYDRHELVKETLEERLLLPEHTNRLWAKQMFPLIYKRIRLQRNQPLAQDIRKFFPVNSDTTSGTVTDRPTMRGGSG